MRQMLLRAVRASKSGGQFTERRTDKQSCGSLPRVKGSSTKAVEHVGGNDSYGNLIPFYGVWRDELCHISYYSRDRKRQRGPENYFARARTRNHQGASIFDVRKEKGRGGLRNTPNLRTNSIDFVDRGGRGTRYPKIMWTSYTGAP